MKLRALDSQVPVTALKFLDSDEILAGIGSFVHLYNWRAGKLVHKIQVFPIQKVHGFVPLNDQSRIVVWGGNSIATVSVSSAKIESGEAYICKDRIVYASAWEGTLFVLTAHNEVLELELGPMRIKKVHRCEERSILYSGSIFINTNKRVVAAGTAFGGVVLWDLETDTLIRKLDSHEGSIFDVTWSENGKHLISCSDDRAVIVSNAETGAVLAHGWGHVSRIWKVKFINRDCILSTSEDCTVRIWRLNESDSLECTKILTGHNGKSVWSFDIVANQNIVASGGGDGKVMLWDLDESWHSTSWKIEQQFGGPVRDCAISPADGTLAVSTVKGKVFLKPLESAPNWIELPQQVGAAPTVKPLDNDFIALSSNGSGLVFTSTGEILQEFQTEFKVLDYFVLSRHEILVIPTPPSNKLVILSLQKSEPQYREVLQQPGMGVITCAAQLTTGHSHASEFITGSRNGGLMIYSIDKPNAVKVLASPLDSKVDAITSVQMLSTATSGNLNAVLTTSRSSDYGVFTLPNLRRLIKIRGRKRGSVEGASQHDMGLILWGFQKDLFTVWNADLGYEMASIDCGGAHRPWVCCTYGSQVLFAYVRNGELTLHEIPIKSPKFDNPSLQQGTHGREIRGLEFAPSQNSLLATASEDTSVHLSWMNSTRDNAIIAASVSDSHISGIQCLHWHPSGNTLLTGAGNGELIVWRVDVMEENVFINEATRMPAKKHGLQELRVMDFSIQDDLIAAGFSDSSIRIWRLSEELAWELLVEDKYSDRCILNVHLFTMQQQNWLFLATTDGCLSLYRLDDAGLTLCERKRLHQSGIRCSELVISSESTLYIYTGGDDNAICAVKYTFEGGGQTSSHELFMKEDAHASAVTNIKYLKDRCVIISTGSDQKIKIWDAQGNCAATTFTDVSDTGVMAVGDTSIVVGGIGLGFLCIED